jgi:hypothetical protein
VLRPGGLYAWKFKYEQLRATLDVATSAQGDGSGE